MATALELRQIRCLDGLYYSFLLLRHYYAGIWETCCKIPTENSQVVPALAACWGFIDSLHRIREIAQSVPQLSVKHVEMRMFLSETVLSEEYRHYIQHLRGELAKEPPNSFPIWGSLSWVDAEEPMKTHIAILGAQTKGTQYTGCVYDSVEKRWVSKVCLGVNNRSFNFDALYSAATRFEGFVIPFLTEAASDEVRFHDKLPIVTVEVVDQGAQPRAQHGRS